MKQVRKASLAESSQSITAGGNPPAPQMQLSRGDENDPTFTLSKGEEQEPDTLERLQ
jgi:hypothetical protein